MTVSFLVIIMTDFSKSIVFAFFPLFRALSVQYAVKRNHDQVILFNSIWLVWQTAGYNLQQQQKRKKSETAALWPSGRAVLRDVHRLVFRTGSDPAHRCTLPSRLTELKPGCLVLQVKIKHTPGSLCLWLRRYKIPRQF